MGRAHRPPNVPTNHKCSRLHGHSYRVESHVRGPVGEKSGWVMDFADIREAFELPRPRLDPYYLTASIRARTPEARLAPASTRGTNPVRRPLARAM